MEDIYSDPHEPELEQVSSSDPATTVHPDLPEPESPKSTPPSAVLVVQLESEENPSKADRLAIQGEPPFQQFLCHLTEKGVARKFYLSTTLENELVHEALLDTAADVTLMSGTLFNTLRTMARRSNRDLKLQTCSLEIQPYCPNSTILKHRALVQITIGPMTLVHPVYVSSLNTVPLLIGKDLLNRFEPLIDFKRLQIWAQVRQPLPISLPTQDKVQCCILDTETMSSNTQVIPPEMGDEGDAQSMSSDTSPNPPWHQNESLTQRDTFLCSFTDSDEDEYCPTVVNGIKLETANVNDVALALWADVSAISQNLYESLIQENPQVQLIEGSSRFPLDPSPKAVMTAIGICALKLRWGQRHLTHFFHVIPNLPHAAYIGGDVLVRLDVQLDTINNILWSLTGTQDEPDPFKPENLKSGQTIPEACQVMNEQHIVVPANTKDVPLRLNIKRGQNRTHSQAFFQPSLLFFDLGLSLEATPLMEVGSRATYLLVHNSTQEEILIPKSTPLGWLISTKFHDFELRIPVIGRIPPALLPNSIDDEVVYTKPSGAITLFPVVTLHHDCVCRIDLADDKEMVLQTVTVMSVGYTPDSGSMPPLTDTAKEKDPATKSEPDFPSQVEQVLAGADALTTDEECEQLRNILFKYKTSFAKDSMDCGLTSIHSVQIPTLPNAPPTYVRQYKIPLASYEPVQEIIDDLLEKGIIRPCNSTYSAPLWPVLKPNGKWRLTIDYRKLNQQVPLSRWPMTQLDQELPKVRNAKYFTSMDIASGFWTIPVQVADQHKLAFTFAGRQYTFTRCPFGYANSPTEFNIFLNKACP